MSGLSSSIQAVRPMEAVHSFSPWLRPPPKPLAPVTARMFSSSGRKSWPRARNSWGTSAASCRVCPS